MNDEPKCEQVPGYAVSYWLCTGGGFFGFDDSPDKARAMWERRKQANEPGWIFKAEDKCEK